MSKNHLFNILNIISIKYIQYYRPTLYSYTTTVTLLFILIYYNQHPHLLERVFQLIKMIDSESESISEYSVGIEYSQLADGVLPPPPGRSRRHHFISGSQAEVGFPSMAARWRSCRSCQHSTGWATMGNLHFKWCDALMGLNNKKNIFYFHYSKCAIIIFLV